MRKALFVLAGAVAVLAWPVAHWGDWWYWYRRYLNSRRWETLSWQVKRRDRHTCQECGHVAARHADYPGGIKWREPMQAHHLPGTYRKWWWYALRLPEPRRNLVCLCEDCHAQAHDKRARFRPQHSIADGFGNEWPATCPRCGAPMQVVRPGDARCSAECCYRDKED